MHLKVPKYFFRCQIANSATPENIYSSELISIILFPKDDWGSLLLMVGCLVWYLWFWYGNLFNRKFSGNNKPHKISIPENERRTTYFYLWSKVRVVCKTRKKRCPIVCYDLKSGFQRPENETQSCKIYLVGRYECMFFPLT